MMYSAAKSGVVLLSANLVVASEKAASAKVELDALRAKAVPDAKEHNIALTRGREEEQDVVDALQATTFQSKATLSKVHDET